MEGAFKSPVTRLTMKINTTINYNYAAIAGISYALYSKIIPEKTFTG